MIETQQRKLENKRLGPFPLLIGVSGHIDLIDDDRELVRIATRQFLSEMKSRYSSSNVAVLSALAEGADQLVAEEALGLGMSLFAALPMQLREYERTLNDDSGRSKLHELWRQAAIKIELPPVAGQNAGNLEKDQFEQLGLFISRYSHILLCIWNGEDEWTPTQPETERERKRGGTAHVFYMRENGEETSPIFASSSLFAAGRTILDTGGDSGPVVRISTRRKSAPNCKGAPGSIWLRQPGAAVDRTMSAYAAVQSLEESAGANAKKESQGLLRRLNDANQLCSAKALRHPIEIMRSEDFVLPRAFVDALEDQCSPMKAILNAYAAADVTAQTNQKNTYRTILGLVAALPAAVLTFEVYGHAFPDPRVLTLYLAVIAFAYAVHFLGVKKYRWQNNFQDFRAISEALRVQLFWALGGLPRGVADYYLRKHRDEMSWIRQALRGPAVWAVACALGPSHQSVVVEHWIKDQLDYFAGAKNNNGKARQNEARHELISRLANISYFVGLGTAAALLTIQLSADHLSHEILEVGVFIMGFAPAIAGALSVFAEKRAFKDHAHSYGRMGRIFRCAYEALNAKKASFSAVIQELGAEALEENGDWLLAHRDRAVEPIKGG